jgi:hypothetical protein
MATQYFGLNRGQQLKDVASGTSSPGCNVELAISDAAGLTRAEINLQVQTLLQFIANQRTTPFAQ